MANRKVAGHRKVSARIFGIIPPAGLVELNLSSAGSPFSAKANNILTEDHYSSALLVNAPAFASSGTLTSPEAADVSTSSIDVSWNAPTGGAGHYRLPASPEATAAPVYQTDASWSAPVGGADHYRNRGLDQR